MYSSHLHRSLGSDSSLLYRQPCFPSFNSDLHISLLSWDKSFTSLEWPLRHRGRVIGLDGSLSLKLGKSFLPVFWNIFIACWLGMSPGHLVGVWDLVVREVLSPDQHSETMGDMAVCNIGLSCWMFIKSRFSGIASQWRHTSAILQLQER